MPKMSIQYLKFGQIAHFTMSYSFRFFFCTKKENSEILSLSICSFYLSDNF